MRPVITALALSLLPLMGLQAGEADVVAAEAVQEGNGTWRFRVTVRHEDEGWDHYADRWQVLTEDGRVLGTRVLLHPHETEQPFTRALGGVAIPEDVQTVIIKAHDSVHGDGGAEIQVQLQR